jgi:hypothetical protein
MTAIRDPRPQQRSCVGERSADALGAAFRSLRKVQDEQMRMWEAFYRVRIWDRRPEALVRESGPARTGSGSSAAADGSRARAA